MNCLIDLLPTCIYLFMGFGVINMNRDITPVNNKFQNIFGGVFWPLIVIVYALAYFFKWNMKLEKDNKND